MKNHPVNDQKIEELSEELSLKLSAKLKSGEITVEKMAETIQSFLAAATGRKNFSDLKKFVENF